MLSGINFTCIKFNINQLYCILFITIVVVIVVVVILLVEFATLTRKDGRTVIEILPSGDVDLLIKKYQDEVEAKKKEKERQKAAESQTKME